MSACELAWCESGHRDDLWHQGRVWHWDGRTISVELAASAGVSDSGNRTDLWPMLVVRDTETAGEVRQSIDLEELDELIVLLTRARRDVADTIKWARESATFV